MTDSENNPSQAEIQPALSLDLGTVGRLRVRPSEFARMMGVSRQSVSRWISSGKVTLGTDGKLDPIEGYRQAIRNTDPARVRARFLRLAASGEAGLHKRIAELEAEAARLREDAEFHEGASIELLGLITALCAALGDEWEDLRKFPGPVVLAAIERWREELERLAPEEFGDIALLDCLEPEAPQ